jgi:hypothetical protein
MPSKKKHVRTQFGKKKKNPQKALKKALKKKELEQTPLKTGIQSHEIANELSISDGAIKTILSHPLATEENLPSTSFANNITESPPSCIDTISPDSIGSTKKVRKKIVPLPGTRRLVDINYYHEQLQNFCSHNPFCNADFSHCKIINEKKDGINSTLIFKCLLCNFDFAINTNRPIKKAKTETKQYSNVNNKISSKTNHSENATGCDNSDCKRNINYDAVLGITNIGSGFSHLEEMMLNLNIPCMSQTKYSKLQKELLKNYNSAARKCMFEAVEEEKKLALANGNYKEGEIPLLTVIVDGCWGKRSYRTNYSALSGCAVIIGFYTKKVLWFGVRNKYCVICERAKNRKETLSEEKYLSHKAYCNVNYVGASTGMETSILVEGFKTSLPLYGVIYNKFIGDGDSSVFKKLTSSLPGERIYENVRIEKIECRNHLLRNLDRKIRELVSGKTKNKYSPISNINFSLKFRSILGKRAYQIRKGIRSAVNHWKKINISDHVKSLNLEKDLKNLPSHVFGCHSKCASYFKCKNVGEIDHVQGAQEDGIFQELCSYLINLSIHSKSLIKNLDSNPAEQFNALVAKHVGGKKINYSLGNSYSMRCAAAVVQFNTKMSACYLQKFIRKVDMENSPLSIMYDRRKKANISKKRCYVKKQTTTDNDYGRFSERPPLDPKHYEVQKDKILEILKENQIRREFIEKNTRDQANSASWSEIRKLMLTASNFGIACTGATDGIIALKKSERIVSNKVIKNKAVIHGKQYEDIARNQLVKQLKKKTAILKYLNAACLLMKNTVFWVHLLMG